MKNWFTRQANNFTRAIFRAAKVGVFSISKPEKTSLSANIMQNEEGYLGFISHGSRLAPVEEPFKKIMAVGKHYQ